LRINAEGINKFLADAIRFPDVNSLQYTGPTMLIGGSRGAYITESSHERIHELFPKARIDMLDAGHWVHAEKAQEVEALLASFLGKK